MIDIANETGNNEAKFSPIAAVQRRVCTGAVLLYPMVLLCCVRSSVKQDTFLEDHLRRENV